MPQHIINIISDPKRIILVDEIDSSYLTDGLKRHHGKADILVLPISSHEVSQLLKYAHDNRIAVTPRGAGTNLAGSTIPNGGIILDLSLMNNIIELDQQTMTVTVESGLYLSDLQQFVEQHGLFYPPDPGEKKSTIGGNISTNAGGMRAVKYGVTRDYVQALEVVLADGTIINVGSKNIKDNTGISLKQLFVGSEGTLGIITRCTLKLITKPLASETIVLGFDSIEQAIGQVIPILKTLTPTALEFVERKVAEWGEKYANIQFPLPDSNAYLIVMLDGVDQDDVNKQRQHLLEKLDNIQYIVANTHEESQKIWTVRGSLVRAVEAVTEQDPIDIVVPINRIAEFVTFTKQLEHQTGVRMLAFGHAGDGNVHLCILRDKRDDKQWQDKLKQVHDALYQKCIELKGLPSAEHGIGTAKVAYFEAAIAAENRALMQQIKHSFDRHNILNSQVYNQKI